MTLPDDDRRLFFLLDRAAHAFRERIDAMCRARLGVSAVQLVALLHVARADGMRPGELAAALGTRAGAVTGLVDRMEAAGLVKRRADKDDAPSFFGQEERYGHRIYAGVLLNVGR